MRVFVSVPVRGRSDAEVAAEKQAVLERVRNAYPNDTLELIDSNVTEDAPMDGDRAGVWYLGKSLELLATADLAVFADGWRDARGCRIERAVCEAYNIPIFPVRDLYDKMARWFYEAFEFLAKAAAEAIDAIFNAFAAVFKGIPRTEKNADIPRRNWTRPRNQKIRPLMFDRRSRVFHCRNAI